MVSKNFIMISYCPCNGNNFLSEVVEYFVILRCIYPDILKSINKGGIGFIKI